MVKTLVLKNMESIYINSKYQRQRTRNKDKNVLIKRILYGIMFKRKPARTQTEMSNTYVI